MTWFALPIGPHALRRCMSTAMVVLLAWSAMTTLSTAHAEQATKQTLEGGMQIWIGENWGFVRADIGPRWTRGIFSVHPHGAIGPSFMPGVPGTAPSIGAYLDLDVAIPLGDQKALQIGPGGGYTFIPGLNHAIGRYAVPQGILQAAYRWDGNLIGLQVLGGHRYDWELNDAADSVWFSGIGLRFEYVVR